MNDPISKIEDIKSKSFELIEKAKNKKELEKIWRQALGRKNGALNDILKTIKDLPDEQKPKVGSLANKVKNEIEAKIEDKKSNLSYKQGDKESFDPTLP